MSATTTTRKLSPAQRDVLRNAMQRGGKVYCSYQSSRDILKECGYIEQVLEIRDDAGRQDAEIERDNRIRNAKEALSVGNWTLALTALQLAQDTQCDLDRKVWWITEAGRRALEAA